MKRAKTWLNYAEAAKSPPIKFQPWLEMDFLRSRLHLNFTGPLNRADHLVVVNSYTK